MAAVKIETVYELLVILSQGMVALEFRVDAFDDRLDDLEREAADMRRKLGLETSEDRAESDSRKDPEQG